MLRNARTPRSFLPATHKAGKLLATSSVAVEVCRSTAACNQTRPPWIRNRAPATRVSTAVYNPAGISDFLPVAAIIVFGDTRHVADQSYNWGSGSSIDGYFPRSEQQVANLQPYADRMRNWCVDTDPICAAKQPTAHNATDHLNYFNVDSQAAASWIKSVASLTNTDSSFTTTVPISRSGTAQDYATVPTATPSGSVTLDTTWTDSASFAACTATSYSQRATDAADATTGSIPTSSMTTSNSTSAATDASSPTTTMGTSIIPTPEASNPSTEVASSTDASSSGAGAASSAATSSPANAGSLLCMLAAFSFFGMLLL